MQTYRTQQCKSLDTIYKGSKAKRRQNLANYLLHYE